MIYPEQGFAIPQEMTTHQTRRLHHSQHDLRSWRKLSHGHHIGGMPPIQTTRYRTAVDRLSAVAKLSRKRTKPECDQFVCGAVITEVTLARHILSPRPGPACGRVCVCSPALTSVINSLLPKKQTP
jgi:hypothetical protein